MPLTSSEENYIKAIFQLQVKDDLVSTNEVAAVLQTSAASVTDMLKKLKSKNLLVYEKYKGFKLNNEGRKIALMVLRKHRLWETFLVKVLHFSWDEVHEVAEQLEHIQSQQLIDHLDDFLGNPTFDPHGDPIPNASGKMPYQSHWNLNKFPIQISGEVTAVGSQSPDILSLLEHKKITIGVRIKVMQNFAFDNSFEIQIKDKELVHISAQLAEQIYVKKL